MRSRTRGARDDRRRLRAVPGVTPRRAKGKPQRAGPEPGKAGSEVFPHQLRAGDVVLYEHGDGWELLGRPTKSVGTQDFVTTIRRVDRPADMREERWRAHERVKARRPA
jgi:hypothetical protein